MMMMMILFTINGFNNNVLVFFHLVSGNNHYHIHMRGYSYVISAIKEFESNGREE